MSAVIASRDDAARITRAVAAAMAVAEEVIVVDGGSSDATVALARRAGARVITAPLPRAAQLDYGARAAQGDVLLLLDVDAALHPDAGVDLRAALSDAAVVAGSFRVRIDADSGRARFVSWVLHCACCLGVGAASTGTFVRREVYLDAGGLRADALLPRHDLLRRLRARGRSAYLSEHPLSVTARGLTRAPLRALMFWATLRVLYAFGVTARTT